MNIIGKAACRSEIYFFTSFCLPFILIMNIFVIIIIVIIIIIIVIFFSEATLFSFQFDTIKLL